MKDTNITIRTTAVLKSKWQAFAELKGLSLTSLIIVLLEQEVSKNDR